VSSILILIALSALSGFAAGSYFSWPSLVVIAAVLTPFAAVVLQRQDFTALPGISMITACLAISQAGFVIAIWFKNRVHLPQERFDNIPPDGRNDDVDRQHKRHQNAQSDPR
jgi:hypothetical protein